MDEQQPADGSPGPAAAATTQPAKASVPTQSDLRSMVIVGGLLAGLGLSMAAGFVMHVVQEASPIGYGINIDGSVLLEVFLAGPAFGFGLALALMALIPARSGPANTTGAPADL